MHIVISKSSVSMNVAVKILTWIRIFVKRKTVTSGLQCIVSLAFQNYFELYFRHVTDFPILIVSTPDVYTRLILLLRAARLSPAVLPCYNFAIIAFQRKYLPVLTCATTRQRSRGITRSTDSPPRDSTIARVMSFAKTHAIRITQNHSLSLLLI